MKVLIATGVFPPESGGPATYSKTLLDELPSLGIEVTVVPFRDVRQWPKVIRHLMYFFILFKKSFSHDVVYAQDPVSVGLPSALAAFLARKPFLLKVVGAYAWEQATGRFGYTDTIETFQTAELPFMVSTLRAIERWVAKRAVRVVVPSKYLGRIVASWGVHKKNIHLIYNGIAPESVGLKQVIRGLLRFKGKLLVTSGRLVPWKGIDGVMRAHAQLRKKYDDLALLVIGSGPEQKHLETLAKELGTTEQVIFSGVLEKAVALRYMRAGDVFVLNTRYEGFSHVLLEAAAIGVPTVTTKVGGNPELIEDNVHGYLVKPDDEKTLMHRIEKLLDSPETRARISMNAKKRVGNFSNKKMVEETATLLKHICAS